MHLPSAERPADQLPSPGRGGPGAIALRDASGVPRDACDSREKVPRPCALAVCSLSEPTE